MLFNSYEFLFAFLPITLVIFWWLARKGPKLALGWLTLSSLLFYGWQTPRFLIVIAASLVLNYAVACGMQRLQAAPRSKRVLLLAGIAINLGFIGYFKYAVFAVDNLNALAGTTFVLNGVVLPIGISFYTFQQIAYLVDRFRDEIPAYGFWDYGLFVTFFPQLIAGPIVHPKEMLPQFSEPDKLHPQPENIAIGLTIFFMGLFKKTVLADGLIAFSAGVFSAAEQGAAPSLIEAWCASLAYTLQLYFDFSGYSDMAIGLGRLFGIKLPLNFDSPYKAVNIIDFWRRWHMTLSRFLRDYVYIPLGGSRMGAPRRYTNLLITMLIGGLWHGAGWTFVLWGGLHGMYLVINHGWNAFKTAAGLDQRRARVWDIAAARMLTFLAVMVGWVLFRSTSLTSAGVMLQSLLGLNGVSLPAKWLNGPENLCGVMTALNGMGIRFVGMDGFQGWSELWHLTLLLTVVWMAPNTQQIMADWQPAYEAVADKDRIRRMTWMIWKPTPRWAIVSSFVTVLAILQISRASEFLYFQF